MGRDQSDTSQQSGGSARKGLLGDANGGEAASTTKRSGASTRGSGASMMTNKVVFRRLPPTLSMEDFLAIVSPLPEHRYFQYCKADYSCGVESAFCRAYLGLRKLDDVYAVCSKFDGYEFADAKGYMYPALVEFAPNQRIPDRTATGNYQFLAPVTDATLGEKSTAADALPCKKPKKQNTLKGTILDDEDFKSFLDKLSNSKSAVVPGSSDQQLPVIGVEAMLKEIEDRHREENDMSKKKSPLVEFIEQKRRGGEMARHGRIQLASKASSLSPGRALAGSGRGASQAASSYPAKSQAQKKKRRDRRREKNNAGVVAGKGNAPLENVKIAVKPSTSAKNANVEEPKFTSERRPNSEEEIKRSGKDYRQPAGAQEQRKPSRPVSSVNRDADRHDGDHQSGRPPPRPKSGRQEPPTSRPSNRQSQPSNVQSRNSADVESATRSSAVVNPDQKLKFVDNDDEYGHEDFERGANRNAVHSRQPGGGRSQTNDKKRQENFSDSKRGVGRNPREQPTSYNRQPSSSAADQREHSSRSFQDDHVPSKHGNEESDASMERKVQKPASGRGALNRTLVFSRSLAAAQTQSTTNSSNAAGSAASRTVRFDPRRGNAPPSANS